jgi:hypothetical protein
MKCSKCGLTVRDGSRLCPNCGEWLGEFDGRAQKGPTFAADDRTIVIPPPTEAYSPPPRAQPRQAQPQQVPPQPEVRRPQSPPPTFEPQPQAAPSSQPAVGIWPAPRIADRVERPAPSTSAPRAFAPEDFDESTTLSARRSKPQFWTLTLPSGVVELVTDRVVIGRSPEFSPDLPTARLIHVEDPTRSVSKNHAVFSVRGTKLVVEDLGSTNGVVVTRSDGHEVDVGVGGSISLEPGARVELGDVVLHVGRA